MPKISIITPSYNTSAYIRLTFETVLQQTFTDWEWIIVDDCSSDNTPEILKEFASNDSRIKVFQNEKNSGASVSRNKGIEASTGEFLAYLDADDLWQPEKLEKQLNFMVLNNLDFTFHNYDMINFEGAYLKSMKSPDIIDQKTLQMFNPIFTSSVMMRKSTVGHIRFKTQLRRRQDYVYWYESMIDAKFARNVGEVLGSYRTGNEESLSHNKLKNISIQWQIYKEYFHMTLIQSAKSIVAYAFHGLKKYFL